MSKNKVTILGRISPVGKIEIIEKDEYTSFISQNKGKDIVLTLESSHGSKYGLTGYYYAHVLPKLQEGFRSKGEILTLESTCSKTRRAAGIIEESFINGYQFRLKGISELKHYELFDYIDWCKIYAAEFLDVYIDDPINFYRNE